MSHEHVGTILTTPGTVDAAQAFMDVRYLLLVLLIGCLAPRPPGPDVTAQQAVVEPAPTPERARFRYHMRQRFDDLDNLVTQLLAGRLDEAKTSAFALSLTERHATTPALESVKVAALAVADSTSLTDASRRTPQLIASCSGCHRGWLPARATAFPSDDATHAKSYSWATERARDGLMSSTDGPWREALEVFAREPRQPLDRTSSRWLHRFARDRLGRIGFDSLDERARSYGEILVTCTGCHTRALHRE
jgi:cytochrome c553